MQQENPEPQQQLPEFLENVTRKESTELIPYIENVSPEATRADQMIGATTNNHPS